jgi:hypothetical protein
MPARDTRTSWIRWFMVNRSPFGPWCVKPADIRISSTWTSPGTRNAIQAPAVSPVREFHAVSRSRSTRCSGRIAALSTVDDTATVLGTAWSSSTGCAATGGASGGAAGAGTGAHGSIAGAAGAMIALARSITAMERTMTAASASEMAMEPE